MTWLRSAVFNALFFPFSAGMAVLGLPLLLAPRAWMTRWVRLWGRGVLAMLRVVTGIRVRVTGLERLPADGPCLIAAKHQSAFDTVVWLTLLPRPAYVLKVELTRLPVWGWLAAHAGHIAVDRQAGAAAMRGLIRAGREAAARGDQIVIFPEGTRTRPGERVPYQPGIAALAAATGLPVIPVATDSGMFWSRRAFRKTPGLLTVAVLPPLPAGLPRPELMARLEEAIEDATARLLAGGPGCG
jgi:1-acyl-sn-glycerol-3-phosphate acyltransferase